jgi:hypothetical protein
MWVEVDQNVIILKIKLFLVVLLVLTEGTEINFRENSSKQQQMNFKDDGNVLLVA